MLWIKMIKGGRSMVLSRRVAGKMGEVGEWGLEGVNGKW